MERWQHAVATILVAWVPAGSAWASLDAQAATSAPVEPDAATAAVAVDAAPSVPTATVDPCSELADAAPDGGSKAAIRFAEQVAACGHAELAESLYREVLDQVGPGTTERLSALTGLAGALEQQGRAAEASAVLEQIVRQSSLMPEFASARLGLPGMPRAPRPTAGLAIAGPSGPVGIARPARPDNAGVAMAAAEERWLMPDGQSSVSAHLEDVRYEAQDRSVGARVARPGIRVRQQLADGIELNGGVGDDLMEIRGAGDSPTRLTYNTGLRLHRSDALRIDLGSRRASLTNVVALQRGPIATFSTAAIEVRPTEGSRYSLRHNRSAFSDGHLNASTRFETEHRLDWGPNLWVGGRSTTIHAGWAEPAAPGEAHFRNLESRMLTVRMEEAAMVHNRRIGYAVVVGVGDGLVSDAPERPQYDLSVRGSYRFAAGPIVEARLQSVRLNASSNGPLLRNLAGVSLNLPW